MRSTLSTILTIFVVFQATAAELTPAERGRKALLETSFIPPAWRQPAYDNVWKRWGTEKEKPADYEKAMRDRYGLHSAPYPNDGLPMGMRKASYLFVKGISIDCLVCHGGSIAGKSYIGLGNSSLDIQSLFEELSGAEGRAPKTPFQFSNVRGTSEAGSMAVYLLGYRNPDLSMHSPRKELGLHPDQCEDVPAWWLLKKKKTMYHTGGADARSVRSKMQFMMTPLTSRADFEKHEAAFKAINEFILSIEPPKYPYPIDRTLAETGEKLFVRNCAKCHGTYGEKWTYPNKIIPLDEIGTDPKRYEGISEEFANYYDQTWFAQEKNGKRYKTIPSNGYQAPPLDGLWATAPYLHNGSAPAVYHVLKSDARPEIFTRSYKTGTEDYDPVKLGWKFTTASRHSSGKMDPYERRKIYDTKQPGRGNGGHTFGDHLNEAERMAVIEYLKGL